MSGSELFAILVAIGMIGFVGYFIWLVRKNARDIKALREHGIATSATVVGRSITRSDRGVTKPLTG